MTKGKGTGVRARRRKISGKRKFIHKTRRKINDSFHYLLFLSICWLKTNSVCLHISMHRISYEFDARKIKISEFRLAGNFQLLHSGWAHNVNDFRCWQKPIRFFLKTTHLFTVIGEHDWHNEWQRSGKKSIFEPHDTVNLLRIRRLI